MTVVVDAMNTRAFWIHTRASSKVAGTENLGECMKQVGCLGVEQVGAELPSTLSSLLKL